MKKGDYAEHLKLRINEEIDELFDSHEVMILNERLSDYSKYVVCDEFWDYFLELSKESNWQFEMSREATRIISDRFDVNLDSYSYIPLIIDAAVAGAFDLGVRLSAEVVSMPLNVLADAVDMHSDNELPKGLSLKEIADFVHKQSDGMEG